MDSPLLPTFRGKSLDDSSDLLADLSLGGSDGDDSFLPSPSAGHGQGSVNRLPPPTFLRKESNQSSGRTTREPLKSGDDDNDRGFHDVLPPSKPKPRFSLFAAPRAPPAEDRGVGDGEDEDEDEGDVTMHAGNRGADGEGEGEDGEDQTIHAGLGRSGGQSAVDREDKLRESLYELRSMNEVFDGFLNALEAAKGHNERLEVRVRQTKALLDDYTALLGQTEYTKHLLENPNWTGAMDDIAALEAEEQARHEAEERQRVEAERAAEAAQRAEEDRLRRLAEAESARETAGRGRGRGGTRGLVRGSRGSGIPSSTRIPSRSGANGGGGNGGNGGTTGGSERSGGGVSRTAPTVSGAGGAKYGHVQSSGYGPPRRG